MLNSGLDFFSADPTVQSAFLGGNPLKLPLLVGTKLYKHTDRPLIRADGTISPWWSLVVPRNPGDPGLPGEVERSDNLGVPQADFARARLAVTNQWNSMSGLLMIQLMVPAYGFYGRCAAQRLDESDPRVVFIGGGWQVWIPNLTVAHAVVVNGA